MERLIAILLVGILVVLYMILHDLNTLMASAVRSSVYLQRLAETQEKMLEVVEEWKQWWGRDGS